MRISLRRLALGALMLAVTARADITISEGTNITVDVTDAGVHVIDLVGGLWLVPPGGGGAERLPNNLHPARQPRFDDTGRSIAYVAEQGQSTELWIYDLEAQSTRPVAAEFGTYDHPDWHPDGDRLVFAADADGDGLDIWELDIPTGLRWRLTHADGNETWPTWSDDGRDLLYVHHAGDSYTLMLRRFGQPDETLLESTEPLSAPTFRPDKSLVTVLRYAPDGLRVDMVILSQPRLVRTLLEDDDLFVGRIAWQDRHRMAYTAGGRVRERLFNSWTSRTVEFAARIEAPKLAPGGNVLARRLEVPSPPSRDLVVRAARLYDGLGRDYRNDVDILVSDGKIVAIESVQPRSGTTVVDLGDITIMPGLIDVFSALPQTVDDGDGARLLAFGVTTIVTDHVEADELDARWADPASPGPRVLRAQQLVADTDSPPWLFLLRGDRNTGEAFADATRRWQEAGIPVLADNWQVGLGAGASLVIGGSALPVSPTGRRYADLRVTNGASAVTVVSGLAHAGTEGLEDLFTRRQAAGLDAARTGVRRFASPSSLAPGQTQVVLGSAPGGLPPGVAQQAELRALVEAGLTPADAIKAATANAATALGLGLTAGRIAPGANANFILVLGDPLASIDDAANVIGVVMNGRFMSVGRLLDRLEAD